MPHYKDGSPAQIGDIVRGKPYNTCDDVLGEVISITPGTEVCDCQFAIVRRVDPQSTDLYGGALRVTRDAQGERVFLTVKIDYGETKAFEKIS
jgi:hypothetical protein